MVVEKSLVFSWSQASAPRVDHEAFATIKMEAEGNKVTECDRLGDTLTHKGNGQTPHKWVCVAWRQAEANATYSQVLLGDKGNGLKYYQGHEKGQKIDVSESRWARSKVSVLSHFIQR